MLAVAFAGAAAGLLALARLLHEPSSAGHSARLVGGLALVAAAGMVVSGLNPSGASAGQETVHSVASTVAALAVTAAAVLSSLDARLGSAGQRATALLAGGLLAVSPLLHDTRFSGLGQRLLWLTLLGWMLLAARAWGSRAQAPGSG